MKENETLLQFPCVHPLKVIGTNTSEFLAKVSAIIGKHVAKGCDVTYSTRVSSGNKYLSVTATFQAESHEQLKAIYEELGRHPFVLVTL
jgi:putative lipoic acid-binding regulatory protein